MNTKTHKPGKTCGMAALGCLLAASMLGTGCAISPEVVRIGEPGLKLYMAKRTCEKWHKKHEYDLTECLQNYLHSDPQIGGYDSFYSSNSALSGID